MAFDDEDSAARRGAQLHRLILATANGLDHLFALRAAAGFVVRPIGEARLAKELHDALEPFGTDLRRDADVALLSQLPATPDHSHDNGELPRPVEPTHVR
jgi:hypothetical protein